LTQKYSQLNPLPGLTQFSGSFDVYLRDDDAGQNNVLSYINNPEAVGEIELYPSGETTGVKFSGSVIVTGFSITSNFDGMVEGSATFQGTGALAKTTL
jgi:hypothetical protein